MKLSIRQFSRNQDPAGAEACVKTLTQSLSSSHGVTMFCAKDEAVPYWQAFSHNTLLTNPTHPIVHAVGDAHDGAFPAVGIAYFYPEQHVELNPEKDPLPEGWDHYEPTLSAEDRKAQDELLDVLKTGKAKYYAEVGSFLYIAIMATLPSHQRKGLGGQIMKHLTDQADAAGKPMYIEASSEGSARLYERHGFVRRSTHTWGQPDVPGASAFTVIILGRAVQPASKK